MNDCIGIDIGFGYTKAYNGKSAVSFRTVVGRVVSSGGFNETPPIEIGNERFYVGDDAQGSDDYYESKRPDFYGSNQWVSLLAQAIKLSEIPTVEGLTIVLGMPAIQYSREKAGQVAALLKGKLISTGNGNMMDLGKASIHAAPQGFGIFLKFLNDHEMGNQAKKGSYAVADIGFHTIDVITVENGKYLSDRAASYPVGVSILLADIQREFSKKYMDFLPTSRALQFLSNPRQEWLGQFYEIESLNELIQKYCDKVTEIINGYFTGRSLDLCIAGGGGVHVVRGRASNLTRKVAIVKDPADANAIGYWLYGLRKSGERSK